MKLVLNPIVIDFALEFLLQFQVWKACDFFFFFTAIILVMYIVNTESQTARFAVISQF